MVDKIALWMLICMPWSKDKPPPLPLDYTVVVNSKRCAAAVAMFATLVACAACNAPQHSTLWLPVAVLCCCLLCLVTSGSCIGLWDVRGSTKGVQAILKNTRDMKMGPPYAAFNIIMGITEAIPASKEHHAMHALISQCLAREHVLDIVARHNLGAAFRVLLADTKSLDRATSVFCERLWFILCLGDGYDQDLLKTISRQIHQYTSAHVHNQRWFVRCIPFFAKITQPFRNQQLRAVYANIQVLLSTKSSGWIHEFVSHYLGYTRLHMETMLLAFLVFDFIKEAAIEVAFSKTVSENNVSDLVLIERALPRAFFYPWRVRVDYTSSCWLPRVYFINLVSSNTYWSYGSRSCPGKHTALSILKTFLASAMGPLHITTPAGAGATAQQPKRKLGPMPTLLEPLRADSVQVKRTWAFETLRHVDDAKMRLYHTTGIFWYPDMMHVLVAHMSDLVSSAMPATQGRASAAAAAAAAPLVFIGIESRGFALAQAMASKMQAAHAMMRKAGKEKGTLVFKSAVPYTTAYSTDSMEISVHTPISKHTFVVLCDDGYGSGGTAIAAYHLIRDNFMTSPQLALFVFNHGYATKMELPCPFYAALDLPQLVSSSSAGSGIVMY